MYMSNKALPQIFGRVGSKTSLKEKVYRAFPKDFTTYVEPFVGGGSVVMGYKFKPTQKIVINDLDSNLMQQYRFIKSNPSIEGTQKYSNTNLETLNRWKDKTGGNKWDKFVAFVLKSNNTYGNTGKGKVYTTFDPYAKIKRIPKQALKLKDITILNESVFSVISKYNRAGVFMYLDPPYENSKDLYEKGSFDFEKLAKQLRTFKGKFLLSINASPNIKKIFTGFKFGGVSAGGSANNAGIGSKVRREYLIKNY